MKASDKKMLILPLVLCLLVCAAAFVLPAVKSALSAYENRGKSEVYTASGLAFPVAVSPVTLSPASGGQKDINTASSVSLQELPGIGPARAEAIILYRENVSPFFYPEDLTRVSGIGSATFEKLKNSICCVPETAADTETESEATR